MRQVVGHLSRGQALLDNGAYPTGPESKQVDWLQAFPERLRLDAAYAKRLRDNLLGSPPSGA